VNVTEYLYASELFLTELAVLYDPLQNNILLSLPPQPTATISYLTWFTW